MSRTFVCLAALALIVGCNNDKKSSTTTTGAEHTGTSPAGSAQPVDTSTPSQHEQAKVQQTGVPQTGAGTAKQPVLVFKNVGLSTPESVLFDEGTNLYLVSNIDGKPLDADGKGFISRLGPDGKVVELKWIESGKNKVTLNAPKGMAFLDDKLYVADLDTVRIFDRKSGLPLGEVKIPGTTFLNGITAEDGRVLVDDTAMKMGGSGFAPTGADAIYAIDTNKKVTTIAKGKDLGNPNGLVGTKDKTYVVTFGTNELYSVDSKGKKGDVTKLPKGQLDGLVAIPGTKDELLVSSWESSTIYRGTPGGEFVPVIENVKSPAGIGYDSKLHRVLVPRFDDNEVDVYDIK